MTPPPFIPSVPPPIPQREPDRRFSLQDVIADIKQSWRRFPVTICYTVYAIIVATLSIWEFKVDEAYQYTAVLGPLLTLAAYIWSEPYEYKRKGLKTLVQLLVNIAIIGDLIYILLTGRSFGGAEITGHTVAVAASLIGIFFRPANDGNAMKAWRFSLRQIASAIITEIISSAVMIAIFVIYWALILLLKHSDSTWQLMSTMIVVLAAALPLMIFMSRIPRGNLKPEQNETSRIITGLTKYLFIPLLGAYMLVLYIYGIKILVTWELPNGYVTWSVTALMAEVLIVEFFLFPLSEKDLRPVGSIIKMLIPALTLPLLILMSVAIGYRINQYGFTAERLYVLTFNLWCYIVMTLLFIDRCRHINWVPLSFTAVMLMTSIIPGCNFSTLGAMLQREDDTHSSEDEAVEVIEEVPDEEADAAHKKSKAIEVYRFEVPETAMIPLPQGATAMKPFMSSSTNVIPDKSGCISIGTAEARGRLNIDSLIMRDDSIFSPVLLKVPGRHNKKLLVTAITATTKQPKDSTKGNKYSVSTRIDGYIFEYNLNTK